jgi:hypothetical protein
LRRHGFGALYRGFDSPVSLIIGGAAGTLAGLRVMTWLCGVFVVLGVVAVATTGAQAGSVEDQPDALIRRGVELRRIHDDEGALPLFEKAYRLAHTARAAAQLGLAEQALGRWDLAESHMLEALRDPSDPWVVKNRSTLENAMAVIGQHIGRIEVIGEPEGADLLVNGRAAGSLPLSSPVHVSAGQVDVELRAPGYTSVQRTLTVVGGQYQRLVVRLKNGAPTAPSSASVETRAANRSEPATGSKSRSPETVVSPEGSSAGTVATSPRQEEIDGGPSRGYAAAKWAVAGGAGLTLAIGVVASIVHEQRASSFAKTCAETNGGPVHSVDGSPAPECQGDLDAFRTARTWQVIGFVGAGALAATWAVLALVEPRPGVSGGTIASTCMLSPPPGLALTCQVPF